MSYVWKEIETAKTYPNSIDHPADRHRRPVATGSVFPPDAVARISRPARSVVTSGKARTKNWVLRSSGARRPSSSR